MNVAFLLRSNQTFVAKKSLEALETFVVPVTKEIAQTPDTIATVRALDELFVNQSDETVNMKITAESPVRLDDAIRVFQELASVRNALLERINYKQTVPLSNLSALAISVAAASNSISRCLETAKQSTQRQVACVADYVAKLRAIVGALGPVSEAVSSWSSIIMQYIPWLLYLAWHGTTRMLLLTNIIVGIDPSTYNYLLEQNTMPDFVKSKTAWVTPFISIGTTKPDEQKGEKLNTSMAKWLATYTNIFAEPLRVGLEYAGSVTGLPISVVLGFFFFITVVDQFAGKVLGNERFNGIFSYVMMKSVWMLTYVSCQSIQWFNSTLLNTVTPQWLLNRLSGVIGVQSTKDLINAAIAKRQPETNATLLADATIILKGVNGGMADIVASEVEKLQFIWLLKTQASLRSRNNEWDTEINSTSFLARGIFTGTNAYVWFFGTEAEADTARQEFRSKAKNRGVRTYVTKTRNDLIEEYTRF